MLFNSMSFLIFFPAVLAVYFLLPASLWQGGARRYWLLVASYYFYMSWNPRYALLMAFSTLVTYVSGLALVALGPDAPAGRRKLVVAASFIINIGILIGFKYFDFLLDNVNAALGIFGIQAVEKPFDVILPVGISFYTFQALSYTVDVYRGDVQAERNVFNYALFVSFFPQLVAGPIERSGNLLKQLNTVPQTVKLEYRRITNGLTIMLWGLFLKMVIADRLAVMVDRIFGEYYLYQSTALIAAAVGFAFQIYCDFASYSTIAIGAAQVMGFTLMENFNTPYFAVSIKDFWRRWHISLSTWFRDYLYIPLGGNRCPKLRQKFNLMVTFLVSGLWHGASWNYVAWGFIHGFYQLVGAWTRPFKESFNRRFAVKTESFSYRLGQILVTFILTDIAWVFFRAETLGDAVRYLRRIVTQVDWWSFMDGSWYIWGMDRGDTAVLLFGLFCLFLTDLVRYRLKLRLDGFLEEQCLWFRWTVLLTLLFATLIFGVYGIDVTQIQFLYFQF